MKKYFLIFFLGIISLVLPAILMAQDIDPNMPEGMVPASQEEIDMLNASPEVYVSGLNFENKKYSLGDIVNGSFILDNFKSSRTPNIYYEISLVNIYLKDLSGESKYGIKKSEELILLPNERKEINFSYQLPPTVDYKEGTIELKISSYTGSGAPLGWENIPININLENTIDSVSILNADLKLNDKEYALNVGPTIHSGEIASLFVKIKNSNNKEISLTPKISIFSNNKGKELIKSYLDKEITIKANEIYDSEYILPVVDLKPQIYLFEINFIDSNGVERSATLTARYIVAGDIVNISGITVNKDVLKKGDTFSVNIFSSGIPMDITRLLSDDKPKDVLGNIDLKIFNEKNKLVSHYYSDVNINEIPYNIELVADTSAKGLRVEMLVTKDGIILDDYKAVLSDYSETLNDGFFNRTNFIIGAGILLLFLFFILLYKKNRKGVFLSLMIILFCLPILKTEAFTVTSSWYEDWTWNGGLNGTTQLTVNSPSPILEYNPGQKIDITGIAYALACNNSPLRIYVSIWNGSSYVRVLDAQRECLSSHYCTVSGGFNLPQSITAPNTPGTYTVKFMVESYYTEESRFISRIYGYQPYKVVAPVNNPKGYYEGSDCTTSWGWTCDADNYAEALPVHLYADGPYGPTGTYLGSATANQNRPDLASVCGGTTAHGFSFPIPTSLKTGTNRSIYAYGINIGSGSNILLSGSPKTINCPAPVVPVYSSCGTASGVSTATVPTSNLCSINTISINPMPSLSGDSTQWFWGCVGSNTGWTNDTAWCFAPKINEEVPGGGGEDPDPIIDPDCTTNTCNPFIPPLDPILDDCTFNNLPPTLNQVNTRTNWNISYDPDATMFSWKLNGEEIKDENSPTLVKYFNTVGLKTIQALTYNGTEYGECTATTTVVQTGGNIQEQ